MGAVPINLHRPIPDGFVIKQVRVISKASGWYTQLILQCDLCVPNIILQGLSIDIYMGLEKFLALSNGKLVKRPPFILNFEF